MKLTKLDALTLTKALHTHVQFTCEAGNTNFQAALQDVVERLDYFLMSSDDAEHSECDPDCKHKEDEDEEAEDDVDEEEDSAEEDDEEKSKVEEKDERAKDDEEDEELEADESIDPLVLHDLPLVKTNKGSLEFEDAGASDSVILIVDGYNEFDITHLNRKAKELHVRNVDGTWEIFNVSKFPLPWTKVLPLNELVEVVG